VYDGFYLDSSGKFKPWELLLSSLPLL
jgi:hypothetical protein